jgi:membrane associated rhomboid family serine protease
VWILNTRWEDEIYTFAMNGQTGKLVGGLPIDWKKAFLIGGGVLLVLAAVLAVIAFAASLADGVIMGIAVFGAIAALVTLLTFIPVFSKKKDNKSKKGQGSK